MAVDVFHFVHQHYGIVVAFLLGVITSFVRSFVRSFQSAGQGQGRAGHLGATEAAGAIDRSIASIFIKWGRKGSLNNYEASRVESRRPASNPITYFNTQEKKIEEGKRGISLRKRRRRRRRRRSQSVLACFDAGGWVSKYNKTKI